MFKVGETVIIYNYWYKNKRVKIATLERQNSFRFYEDDNSLSDVFPLSICKKE